MKIIQNVYSRQRPVSWIMDFSWRYMECRKHKQALAFYCDDQGCQTAVCSEGKTIHKGHKITDIDVKAGIMEERVEKLLEGNQKMKDVFTEQLQSFEETNEKLKRTETKTLNDLDRTRASLYQQIDKAIDAYKETVKKNREIIQKQIEESSKIIEQRKAKLEKCSKIADQVMTDNNPSSVITQCQFIISQYFESARVSGADGEIRTCLETMSFFPAMHEKFAEETVGKMISNLEFISLTPVKATIVKSVHECGESYPTIACGREGEIYTSVYEKNRGYMSTFDTKGDGLSFLPLGCNQQVRSLVCAYVNGQGILILVIAGNNSIQIRNCEGLRSMHSLALGWEPAPNAVCITPNNDILVSNYSESDSKVIEYQVNNMGVVETGKCLGIPVRYVYGLCHVIHDAQHIVVASSSADESIVAVDYNTGDVVWRIDHPICEGQAINPRGISSDGEGHIFVSDANRRVCMMTTDGKIHHTLLKHNASIEHQAWISTQRKLVVRDENGYFHVCDVSYEKV